jgi:Tol biopolymer transport system component
MFSSVGYSPDGATIAYIMGTRIPGVAAPRRNVVLTKPGGAPRLLDVNPAFSGGDLRFTPDGSAVAYAVRDAAGDNIYIQPLDGSAGRMLTHFREMRIARFQWSPDGSRLAILRTDTESDVVVIADGTDLHPH